MKKHLHKLVGLLLAGIMCSDVQAQTKDTLEIDRNDQKVLRYAKFKPGNKERKLSSAIPFLQQTLEAKNGETFVLISSKKDELGITHNKYQQVFKGVPLEGVQYLVHGRGDDIETINGQFVPVSLASVAPQLNPKKALEKALGYVNAKKYAWEDQAMETTRKLNPVNGKSTYRPNAELVIAEDMLSNSKEWKLAYKFQILCLEPFKDLAVFIDANSGNLLSIISQACEGNSLGSAETLYSSNQVITGDSYNGQYRLRETRNGTNILTLDARGLSENIGQEYDFFDNDNSWTEAEHSANQAALDVHWGAEKTLDYFWTFYGRNSLDGQGKAIRSFINYPHPNAAWVPSSEIVVYGNVITPYSSLDIVAHEIGHGICKFEANLVYAKESGALNEGFSDIWAALVENWAKPGNDKWLCGEDRGFPIRSMENPNSLGQPDTYGASNNYWFDPTNCSPNKGNDNCGVHRNSGVLNFCFYLMCEGGTGTNDNGWPYSVVPIGLGKSGQIAYRALTNYLTSNATFADARNAFIQSAIDLYGNCSPEVISTTNAWYAVGVGNAYRLAFQLQHEYIPENCNNVNVWTYFVNHPITWHTTSNLLVNGYPSPYTTAGSSVVLTNTGSSYGEVYATYNIGNCIYTSDPISICPCTSWNNANFRFIWSNPAPGEPVQAAVDPHPDAIGYNWYYDGQLVEQMGGEFFGYYDWDCGEHGIGVVAVFQCGSSQMVGSSFEGLCSFRAASGAKLYPNPAANSVTIELTKQLSGTTSASKKNEVQLTGITQIRVIDKLGIVRIQKSFTGKNERSVIDLSALSTDIYFVELFDGKNKKRFPLMVKKK